MTENEYKCEYCGNIYEKGWSDEEANKEAVSMWGVENAATSESMAVICDDCFIKMTGVVNS